MKVMIGPPAESIEDALHSERPELALQAAVIAFLRNGYEPKRLLHVFEEYRERLQNEGRDKDEDLVLEIMDVLCGSAPPQVLSNFGLPANA